jgi:hypothetical protein
MSRAIITKEFSKLKSHMSQTIDVSLQHALSSHNTTETIVVSTIKTKKYTQMFICTKEPVILVQDSSLL